MEINKYEDIYYCDSKVIKLTALIKMIKELENREFEITRLVEKVRVNGGEFEVRKEPIGWHGLPVREIVTVVDNPLDAWLTDKGLVIVYEPKKNGFWAGCDGFRFCCPNKEECRICMAGKLGKKYGTTIWV